MADVKFEQSLAGKAPEITEQWNFEKNIGLTPETVNAFSKKKVWWQCEKGHEWKSSVNSRTNMHTGCPICSGRKVVAGFNDLATTHPALATEWHPIKNKGLMPTQVTKGSKRVVWWLCKHMHEWDSPIYYRALEGQGCPICSGHRVCEGVNDLQTCNPELAAEWHAIKNGSLMPTQFTAGSSKKVWWICKKGHEYQCKISVRNKGVGCPYCSNKKVLEGYNDLASQYPDIINTWYYDKNQGLKPTQITSGSEKKVWWICKTCKGSWQTTVCNRISNNSGCPYCTGRKILLGYNDLETLMPDIMRKWHPTKNKDKGPRDFTKGSGARIWLICDNGHEYQTVVNAAFNGSTCPICSNQQVLEGYNDLLTKNPLVAREWHPTKNGKLLPTQVVSGSNKKVWWKCPKGHEWQAAISERALKNTNCPICGVGYHTSFAEQGVYYYLARDCEGVDVQSRAQLNIKGKKIEVDVYIPELKIGIEYDGEFWHKNKSKADKQKDDALKNMGIRIFRIKEDSKNIVSNDVIFFNNQNDSGTNLSWAIEQLELLLSLPAVDIDVDRDRLAVLELYKNVLFQNSVEYCYPDIAKEWNYAKNGNLKPDQFSKFSNEKVWWICSNGHEWLGTISKRTFSGRGCPYCAGKKVLTGYNDLMTTSPELVKEWDYDKNIDIAPEDVSAGSGKVIWWRCKSGHSWKAKVDTRRQGSGCPYCSGTKTLTGFNDFESQYPELAKEWNYDKNIDVDPSKLSKGSIQKVWWKCKLGHEWQMPVITRTFSHQNCPFCSGKRVLAGFNDILTTEPNIAAEWNYAKNIGLDPKTLSKGSHAKVWWKCKKGHEWQTTVNTRTNHQTGCPYCSGTKLLIGFNDLETACPEIAEEWDLEKNAGMLPSEVNVGTKSKAWWQGHCGHSWYSTICDRVTKKTKCPYCSNKKLLVGFNDLATKFPDLVEEWDCSLNGELKPDQIMYGSSLKVWWKCSRGHQWQTKINERTRKGSGCPICYKNRKKYE